MRKPVSKHALRRAMEQVMAEGRLRLDEPAGTVVDRIWHHIEKETHFTGKKKGAPAAVRRREPVAAV